jgi:hypothetical protein
LLELCGLVPSWCESSSFLHWSRAE